MQTLTAILIGAGLRGARAYAPYALQHPQELRFVAVAEPDVQKRTAFAKAHGIAEDLQFATWEDLLNKPKLADCALVCTQDNMHFAPVMQALQKGYHVLCEKPMSNSKAEIVAMGEYAKEHNRILSICHVLRYSPFFCKIKELLQNNAIGDIINIDHRENVGYWHHAHSFVRGNWRNAAQSSPMILQKCCHDMDILLWLVDSACKQIFSMGSLRHFTKENAPQGVPMYCMDACPHADNCPYYAPRFYLQHPRAVKDDLVYAVCETSDVESVLQALQKGPYGRCVYHCDNTVVDHQVVQMEFENGVHANLTMTAFTKNCSRDIHIFGTKGELFGNMEQGSITIHDFTDGSTQNIQLQTSDTGHMGSDERLVQDFVQSVLRKQVGRSSAERSVESHLMAFAAEESRISGKAVQLKTP